MTETDPTPDDAVPEPYPKNDDGSYDYDQMLDEMGIETTEHPTLGWPHRLGGDLVEIHSVRYGELQLESREYGNYEQPVTELYDQWRNGNLDVTPVSMRGVASDETIVPTSALSVLTTHIQQSSDLPGDVRNAVDTVTGLLCDEDIPSPDRTYGLFADDPQDPHTLYTMIGDPVTVDPTDLSVEELRETVRDRVQSETDLSIELSEQDTFLVELAAFPVTEA